MKKEQIDQRKEELEMSKCYDEIIDTLVKRLRNNGSKTREVIYIIVRFIERAFPKWLIVQDLSAIESIQKQAGNLSRTIYYSIMEKIKKGDSE